MIYLDNSATTKPHPQVVEVVSKAMQSYYGNPSSLHHLGVEAEKVVKQARSIAATALQVKPGEIIFTSGGTESNNLALKGIAFQYQNRGKHIITSQVEHPAVYSVCKQLEEFGFRTTYLPVDSNGRVSPKSVKAAITNETILVSIMHVNNELGTIQPIQQIGQLLKEYPRILFHVDAVQSFGKIPLQIREWGIDLLSLSAHKFHGPRGVGILVKKEGVSLHPLLIGGGQEGGIRSGTENVPGIAGMAKAIKLISDVQQMEALRLSVCIKRLREGLASIPDCVINTPATGTAPHMINFSIPGIKAEVLVHALEEKGFIVSTRSACSSKANEPSRILMATGMKKEQALSAIRVSLSQENKMEEIEQFLVALEASVNQLRPYMNV
ncbi:cysteine desulfurase family protein [Brevibacillus sp. SYSU BS000544]|uniref:cysteine desulfurase family protein n=1 Tax=Brevibacillus sp. SYSU BS000544 TaxID=3416443 RepID=UPI003CE5302C